MLGNVLVQHIVILRDSVGMSLIGLSCNLGPVGTILALRLYDADEQGKADGFVQELSQILSLPIANLKSDASLAGARETLGTINASSKGSDPFVVTATSVNYES